MSPELLHDRGHDLGLSSLRFKKKWMARMKSLSFLLPFEGAEEETGAMIEIVHKTPVKKVATILEESLFLQNLLLRLRVSSTKALK